MMSTQHIGMTMRLLSLCALSTDAALARGDTASVETNAKRSTKAGARVDRAAFTGAKAKVAK